MEKRVIFIGGCPRSGTTLLGDHLGAAPDCVVTPESQFKKQVIEIFDKDGPNAAINLLKSDFRFRLWGLFLDEKQLLKSATSEDFILSVVDQYAKMIGKDRWDVWIDHTPINLKNWSFLSKKFSNPQFIHIIRDGRGVAASVIPLDWGPNNIVHAAEWWSEGIAVGLALSGMKKNNIIELKYEELLTSPTDVLNLTSSKLGLNFCSKMVVGGGLYLPKYTHRQHALVGKGIDSSRIDGWKSSFSKRDIELFELRAGGLLAALDYDLETEYPKAPTRLELLRMREWPVQYRIPISLRIRYMLRKVQA